MTGHAHADRPKVVGTAITLGVLGSMAGNVAWAWPKTTGGVTEGSWILVGVGVGMSLVLPVAVTLWRAVTPDSGWTWARFERAAVMSAICGGAALYSLVHTTLLLHDAGLPRLIAWIPGTVLELLVVMAARAGTPVPPTPERAGAGRQTAASKTPGGAGPPQPKATRKQPAAVTAAADPAVTATVGPVTAADEKQQRQREQAAERQRQKRARDRQGAPA